MRNAKIAVETRCVKRFQQRKSIRQRDKTDPMVLTLNSAVVTTINVIWLYVHVKFMHMTYTRPRFNVG